MWAAGGELVRYRLWRRPPDDGARPHSHLFDSSRAGELMVRLGRSRGQQLWDEHLPVSMHDCAFFANQAGVLLKLGCRSRELEAHRNRSGWQALQYGRGVLAKLEEHLSGIPFH